MNLDRTASSCRSFLSFAVGALLLSSLAACAADSNDPSGSNEPSESAAVQPATPAPAPAPVPAAASARTNPAGTGESASGTFATAIGGSLSLSDGTMVDVPAGASDADTVALTLTSSTDAASSTITTVTPTYRFASSQASFTKAFRVYIPVTVPKGATKEDLAILWSGATGSFEAVPTTFLPVDGDPSAFLAVADVERAGMGAAGFKTATAR